MKRFIEVLFWARSRRHSCFCLLIYTVLPIDHGTNQQKLTTGDKIAAANLSDIPPDGELGRMFSFFSDATEIQRAEKERQIAGCGPGSAWTWCHGLP
jgi:hypothetical protein